MNNKKTSKRAIRYAKETKLGRFLCRLAGEENGQAMMEYVIIAVCIAAAVALGAWFFGAQILGLFGIAGDGAMGRHQQSRTNLSAMQNAKPGQNAAADNADKQFTDDQQNRNLVQPGN